MNQSDAVDLSLKGKVYKLRFTLPRVKEINALTGKGLQVLLAEALQLNYASMEMVLWAGLAHPGNSQLRDMPLGDVAKLFTMRDTRSITKGILAAFESSMGPAEESGSDEAEDPQKPAAAA